MGLTETLSLLTVAMFAAMLILLEAGRWLGAKRIAQDPDGARTGIGVIEASVFGLMGLLMAFSFSGAADRFTTRRQLIVEEANAIGTAWLRLDLLPQAARDSVREGFRSYLDARIEAHRSAADLQAAARHLERGTRLQQQIWSESVKAAAETGSPQAPMLVLPALNTMIDITTTRLMATRTHQPAIVFIMLEILTMVCAFMAGFAMAGSRSRNWIHMVAFAMLMSLIMYIIMDLEYPRLGLIRVDSFDEVLMELRRSMN